ncbi:MAG: hypothetical protein ACRECJ_10020, partial [Limisphaerales bacterium]
AQPDPRDSVIIESRLINPGTRPGGAFDTTAYLHVGVYIRNKDTLTNFTLPVEILSAVGNAFAVLGYPRTFGGTIHRLTSTLGNNLIFSSLANSTSPDSAMWAGSWDSNDIATTEPPNLFPKHFWDIKFDTVKVPGGQVAIDSATILGNQVGFVNLNGESIKANFARGIIDVISHPCFFYEGCPYVPFSVLFGRPFTYDFNAECENSPHSYSIVVGPGSIDPITGVYNFSGQCPIGDIPAQIRIVTDFGISGDCGFTIRVVDNPPSCSPSQNVITVSHGLVATNQIIATDPDTGDEFAYSVLSGPGTVNSNGVWSYTTGCEDVPVSPQTIKIKVADAFGSCSPGPRADTCQFQLVVTNSPPVFTWPASTQK